MPNSLSQLDVREKRGIYLIFTRTGTYRLTARKNVAGQVTLSGGSLRIPEQEVCLEEPIVKIGAGMQPKVYGRPVVYTTAVQAIHKIDTLSEPEVSAIIAEHTAEEATRPREWWEDPPPVVLSSSPR